MLRKGNDNRAAYIACATGAVSLALCLAALSNGGIALMLLWPAASSATVCAGYAFLGPSVCGKQDNGGRKLWATTLHLPSLAFSHTMWRIGRLLQPDAPCNCVAEGIYVGRKPDRFFLRPPGTTMIVDMTAEYTQPRENVDGVKYLCIPTLDGTAKTSSNFAEVLRFAAEEQGIVFVHCAVGYGRAGMFAASLLMARGLAADVEAAEVELRRSRPLIKLRPSHKSAIARLFAANPDLLRDRFGHDVEVTATLNG